MRFLLVVTFLALPLNAAWQRYVGTPKGDRVDTPEPHPLAYFTEYPMLRNESADFCSSCSPAEKLAEAKKFKIKTDLNLVGTLAGYPIYDLFYRFETPGFTDTKLVLVKTGPDEYRQIYYRDPTQVDARAEPSTLVRVGNDQFLEAAYTVGGNGGDVTYEYFWFDKTGATLVDFRPILIAAKSELPTGRTVKWIYEMGRDVPGSHYLWYHNQPLRSRVSVTSIIDNKLGFEYLGIVDIEFKFDGGRVVVTKASYDAAAK